MNKKWSQFALPQFTLKKRKYPRTTQSGFTLIELLIALGIGTLVAVAAIQGVKRSNDYDMANAAATQVLEVNAALDRYIADNSSALIAAGRTEVTFQNLIDAKLLPATYQNRTPFGGTMKLEVVSNGGANPMLEGLITTTPWTDNGTATGDPRYDLLGAAIRKIGAQGGYSYYSNDTISGLNAGWGVTKGAAPGQFTYISSPGQLAVRSYSSATGLDNIYLRRDGALPMLGNLDMGFHDINNAVNISANGWMYANHLAANDATIASLFTNYIRNTGGIDTTQVTGIGDNSAANFEYLTARTDVTTKTMNNQPGAPAVVNVGTTENNGAATPGKGIMNVQDLYIRDARGIGSYLSDRLPRYVSKGAYFVPVLPPNAPINTGFNQSGCVPAPGKSCDIGTLSVVDNPAVYGDNNYKCSYGQTQNGINFNGSNSPAPTGKVEVVPGLFQHKTYLDFSEDTMLRNDPSTNIVYGTIGADVSTTPLHVYAEAFSSGGPTPNDKWVIRGGEPINGSLKITDLQQHYVLVQVFCDYYKPL